mmetsp:Transcript_595/g.1391  ORF Transcript_595/g.1391 Transcript_595/m.1391 type:complete len:117 (+) Transcript_595:637-987(+)
MPFFSSDLRQNNDDDDKAGATETSKFLSLEDAYEVIFTEAEREHLTYEHFLEDWVAFATSSIGGEPCHHTGQRQSNLDNANDATATTFASSNGDDTTDRPEGMTYDSALRFLEANQ